MDIGKKVIRAQEIKEELEALEFSIREYEMKCKSVYDPDKFYICETGDTDSAWAKELYYLRKVDSAGDIYYIFRPSLNKETDGWNGRHKTGQKAVASIVEGFERIRVFDTELEVLEFVIDWKRMHA